jgi:hypothetical protein
MTRGGEIGILTEESSFHLPERLETERLILRRWETETSRIFTATQRTRRSAQSRMEAPCEHGGVGGKAG